MHDYLKLSQSIVAFLKKNEWVHKATIESKASVWKDVAKDLEIVIPEPYLIEHPQSHELIHEAVKKLAHAYGFNEVEFEKHLAQGKVDVFRVRASGKNIETGKINFKEGLQSYENLYNLIKDSARKHVNVKGKKTIIDDYLAGVNMLAPSAGSFIYSFESYLLDTSNYNGGQHAENLESVGRYINLKFAHLLDKLFSFSSSESDITASDLIQNRIDFKLCEYFLHLFSEKSEKLDFEFSWSVEESLNDNAPRKITFDTKNRDRIKIYKEILKRSTIKNYSSLPACIERFSWPRDDDEGKVSIRITIEGSDYVCSILISDVQRFEQLKAEPIRQQVLISADIVRTIGAKTSIGIAKLRNIKLSNQNIIEF